MALTNAQYDELMRGYQQKQWQARQKALQKKQTIYNELPMLAQIDDQIGSISVRKAKEYISGNQNALVNLDAHIAQLTQKKQQLLREAGYGLEAFEPQYQCPDCQDTGYINNKKCHCFIQAELAYTYQQSNIHARLSEENFDKFSLSYYGEDDIDSVTQKSSREYANEALSKAKRFIADFDSKTDNLLLYGDTGTGKTFLTNCIAKELLETGHSVIYFSAVQLFDLLRKYNFGKGENEQEYQNLFQCDLLIIDDLGTEVPNTYTTSQFFQCINERHLRGKSTIISTNLALKDLTSIYSERISSRITSYFTLVKMYGRDIRILKKLNGE